MFRIPLIALFFALAACATVDGVGQDVQSAGEAVSDTAQDVSEDI